MSIACTSTCAICAACASVTRGAMIFRSTRLRSFVKCGLNSASTSTAWGSWQSATNPTLRDTHEYILVFSKGSFRREKVQGRESTISKEEFLEFTKSVWEFTTESARKVGHPAPFPVELPYRLIQLYTFSNEIVLDPFIGSGQTAVAALKSGRHFVGYEVNGEYVSLAWERIRGNRNTLG